MFSAIASVVGRVGSSVARASGETMPIVQKAPEIAAKTTEVAAKIPKPPSPEVLSRIGNIESNALNKGPSGVREGLGSIAKGLNETLLTKDGDKKDNTKSDEEKLREELEAQRKQREEEQMKRKKEELIDTIAEGLQSPDRGPEEPTQGIISKTIEETPEAVGEKPENLPRETP